VSLDLSAAKALFEDSEANRFYVDIPGTRTALSKLQNATKNPFKIILIYGRPGTGKSYVVHRFFENYHTDLPLFYFPEPVFDPHDSLLDIWETITGKRPEPSITRQALLEQFKTRSADPVYILLDEAQMYSEAQLEWIRILSNLPVFKFIIVIHDIKDEALWARDHFKTRTFETIELGYLSAEQIGEYINKKFLLLGNLELSNLFGKTNFKRIYKLTKGNLRDINRLMHRILEILEWRMTGIKNFLGGHLKNKYIEMAALDLKMIHG